MRVDFEKAAEADAVRESRPVAVAKSDLDSIVNRECVTIPMEVGKGMLGVELGKTAAPAP